MKIITIILSVVVMLFSSTALFAETTIRITNGEWEPYLSEYSNEYGLASHIVSEAFKAEGIHVIWGFFPWKRSYEMAKYGKDWDASAVWWPTDEVKESFLVTEPVVRTSFVFFHMKSRKFQWETVNDLKGLRIGFTRGYDYGKEFMGAVKKGELSVDPVAADEQNFRKLMGDRIDIFPNDPVVGYAQIRNNFSAEEARLFKHHPKEFEVNTLNLIISKKCVNGRLFLEKFNSGMKKLKDSGRLEQMFKDLNAGKYDKQKNKWNGQ